MWFEVFQKGHLHIINHVFGIVSLLTLFWCFGLDRVDGKKILPTFHFICHSRFMHTD